MPQTRVDQVIDRLVELAAGQAGYIRYGQPGADEIIVFDGPEWSETDDPCDALVVGWSGGDDDAATPAATSNQTAGPIAAGNRPRDEVGTVLCRAIAQTKDSPKAARDAAKAIVVTLAGLCRADPSLALNTSDTIGGVRTIAYVTTGDLVQYNSRGYVAEWEFTITFLTRV